MRPDELAPGLVRWSTAHPGWEPRHGWEREVTSHLVVADDATLLLDPLVPEGDDTASFWTWLDAKIARVGERPLRSSSAAATRLHAREGDVRRAMAEGLTLGPGRLGHGRAAG